MRNSTYIFVAGDDLVIYIGKVKKPKRQIQPLSYRSGRRLSLLYELEIDRRKAKDFLEEVEKAFETYRIIGKWYHREALNYVKMYLAMFNPSKKKPIS